MKKIKILSAFKEHLNPFNLQIQLNSKQTYFLFWIAQVPSFEIKYLQCLRHQSKSRDFVLECYISITILFTYYRIYALHDTC